MSSSTPFLHKIHAIGPAQFEDKEYDVSMDRCCWIVCCPLTWGISICSVPYRTTLHLGAEEVTKTDLLLVGRSEAKMPYGELGHVAKGNCCCCVGLSSSFGQINPGCGCDGELVDQVVDDLKARQAGRGDQGQIQRQEATMVELQEIHRKVDLIMDHLNIERD